MKHSEIYPWFLLILLSIIWGSSPILIKKSLATLTPFEIGALRISSAAIFLSPFFFIAPLWNHWKFNSLLSVSLSSNKN